MDTSLTLLAVAVAAASMIFTGFQTRLLSRQTAMAQATSELSFNLGVMMRLGDILFRIAEDPNSHRHIWGEDTDENDRRHVAIQSLLDVISMALAAVDRLPGFSRNQADWSSYTEYVLEECPTVLKEVLAHPDWWPEVTPFAESMEKRLAT